MKTMAVLFSLLGIMAMVTPNTEFQTTRLKSESVAVNYATYRNAVNNFATSNSTITSGPISDLYLD